jgi:uncharacterized membrane protein YhiD involved in acid resistance
MSELMRELERFKDQSGIFSLMDIALALLLAFVLMLFIAWVYRYTHRGVSYSQSSVHNLVLLGTVVTLIMLVVGSNIARAFALIGALSIIRFRNAVKEPRDVGFIFLALAVGMAVGTRFYLLAAFATVMISAFVVVLYKFNLFSKEVRERILRVQFPAAADPERELAETFREHLEQYATIAAESVPGGELQEVVFSVVLKRRAKPERLIEAVRAKNGGHKVVLILGQQEVDI